MTFFTTFRFASALFALFFALAASSTLTFPSNSNSSVSQMTWRTLASSANISISIQTTGVASSTTTNPIPIRLSPWLPRVQNSVATAQESVAALESAMTTENVELQILAVNALSREYEDVASHMVDLQPAFPNEPLDTSSLQFLTCLQDLLEYQNRVFQGARSYSELNVDARWQRSMTNLKGNLSDYITGLIRLLPQGRAQMLSIQAFVQEVLDLTSTAQ